MRFFVMFVTAVCVLFLHRFPLRGREPSETRFWRGVEIRGFNQTKKFLRQVAPQNKPYYFSEKDFGVRCTLTSTLGRTVQDRRFTTKTLKQGKRYRIIFFYCLNPCYNHTYGKLLWFTGIDIVELDQCCCAKNNVTCLWFSQWIQVKSSHLYLTEQGGSFSTRLVSIGAPLRN